MTVTRVTDANDPALTEVRDLTDVAARRSLEAEHGCFVAEGMLTLETVIATGHRIRTVLVDDRKLDRVMALLGGNADAIDVRLASRALMADIAGFPLHRGVIASVDRPAPPSMTELLDAGPDRVLLVEGVNDHENIGSIFRAAAAFGVGAVLLDERCADPLYRRSVRVSLGNVLRVPWTRVHDVVTAAEACRDHAFTVAALAPDGATSIHDLEIGDRVAFLIGAEGPGLTDEAITCADEGVAIPIDPAVDSLNVATAAAIALSISRR